MIASSESYYVILIFLSIMRLVLSTGSWRIKNGRTSLTNNPWVTIVCLISGKEGKEMHTQEKWHSFFHIIWIFFFLNEKIYHLLLNGRKWLLGTILNSTYLEILYNHRKFCDHILWKWGLCPLCQQRLYFIYLVTHS